MTKVMKGVRVLEVAQFTFVPAAGAVMADWGADVIKIEHPVRGDAQRGVPMLQRWAVTPQRNALMQHANRGKRSVGLDLSNPNGLELLYELAKHADVFLTNYLPGARRKLRIDLSDLRQRNPQIIYARGTALGDKGPERERGGFDSTAFWARGGSAMMVTPAALEAPLPQPGAAYGDSIGAMNLAGAVAAALFHRERTGEATEVDVSLLSSGVWATGCSIDLSLEHGRAFFQNPMPKSGGNPGNPFVGVFKTSDGRAINLTIMTPGPHIRDTFEHLGLPELADDPRFGAEEALLENASAASELMVAAFARNPFAYWLQRLSTLSGQWAPYQDVLEAAQDPQVLANELLFEVEPIDAGAPIKLIASPAQFDREPIRNTRAPEASEHTELVLRELGVDPERIRALQASRAIA